MNDYGEGRRPHFNPSTKNRAGRGPAIEELREEDTPCIDWQPLPGPQEEALTSEAHIKGYGGAAGGGKSDLLLGAALTRHTKSIIFRREYPQLKDIIGRSREIIGEAGKFNATQNLWRIGDRQSIEFGAVQYEQDKNRYKGRPHDLKAFDELTEFTESQFKFLIAWNRTTLPGQKCEVIATFNPPTSSEGEWVLRFFGPWLDRAHPHPALPGELRWYAMVDGEEKERENGDPFEWKGETIVPRSRTFFPARLADNPHLVRTGYGATLQSLPEPLRSQLLYGDFAVGREDHKWQLIATEWVLAAQERWKKGGGRPPGEGKLECIGVDVARGGDDKTVLAIRHQNWFAELEAVPGKQTTDGQKVAALVMKHLTKTLGARANIDVIGVGASAYDILRSLPMGRLIEGVNFAASSHAKDKSGMLHFRNMRAEAYWTLREGLDPALGGALELPPDPELLADLCAPRWRMQTGGVQVEAKEEIVKRIGRSPDKGDAVALAMVEPSVASVLTALRGEF